MIDKAKRATVFLKCDGHCAYCGTPITLKSFQPDHVVAKCNRGSDDLDNLMPSCRSCNNYKAVYSIEQFRRNIQEAADVQRRGNSMFRILERYGIIKQVKTEVVFYFEERRG